MILKFIETCSLQVDIVEGRTNEQINFLTTYKKNLESELATLTIKNRELVSEFAALKLREDRKILEESYRPNEQIKRLEKEYAGLKQEFRKWRKDCKICSEKWKDPDDGIPVRRRYGGRKCISIERVSRSQDNLSIILSDILLSVKSQIPNRRVQIQPLYIRV